MLKIGQNAPAFSLPDQDNSTHRLKDYLGDFLLVYFYPKDNTSGCTKEACTLSDALPTFQKLKMAVVGISADSVASHKKFAEKYRLAFPLLSDPEKTTLEVYGVWQKKKFMGREYMGIVRTSFLIDPKGKIIKIYQNVKPEIHAQEVLDDMKNLR